MSDTLGLYLHVPFCLKKCAYCDFYSVSDVALEDAYVAVLCEQLERFAPHARGKAVDSIFFGGGTPSLLTGAQMQRIFKAISRFDLTADCEISLELNPATADLETLLAYRSYGINRISIGMQSAREEELKLLGRLHTHKDTVRCVESVKRAGFENFSLDLMYGLPGQDLQSWKESLEAALASEPDHLSLYALSLSADVPLYALRHTCPDDEMQRIFYETAAERVERAGLLRYEISNFAREGAACRHNLRYWKREEYAGFGPSAASFFEGRRVTWDASLSAFLQSTPDLYAEVRKERPLEASEVAVEELMLRLRLREGIERKELPSLPDEAGFWNEVQTLFEGGFLVCDDKRLALSKNGFFVSNEILTRLIYKAGL